MPAGRQLPAVSNSKFREVLVDRANATGVLWLHVARANGRILANNRVSQTNHCEIGGNLPDDVSPVSHLNYKTLVRI